MIRPAPTAADARQAIQDMLASRVVIPSRLRALELYIEHLELARLTPARACKLELAHDEECREGRHDDE